MKKIALFLFLIFAAVQVGTAAVAFFSDNSALFIVDEEQVEKKGHSVDYKVKSTCAFFQHDLITGSNQGNPDFHTAEKIHSSPYLEQHAPPPNYC